jgi:CheY-like chemotaxis protein
MSLFASDKEKHQEPGSSLALAYLEEALRLKSPFLLRDASKNEVPASIHGVDEDAGTFRLLFGGILDGNKGERIEFIVVHEGLRIGGATQVVELRTGMAVLRLPDRLELKERRRSPRARLNPKEGVTANAFQDLLEGVALSGTLENLSEHGFKIRVENAITISTEKRLVLGTTLTSPGQAFKIIRLNKVPKCPAVMELSGKVAHIAYDQAGLVLGFAFNPPASEIASALQGLMASRTAPIPISLPPKTRRPKKREEIGEEEAEKLNEAGDFVSMPDGAQVPVAAPMPPIAESSNRDTLPPIPETKPVSDRHAALLRLKKMSRAMIIYSPGYQSGILKRFLGQHGFGRILVASTMEVLLDELQQPNPGVLFIDWDGGTEDAIELMKLLKNAFENLPPAVLAARQVSEDLLTEISDAGFSDFIKKPFACDDTLASLLDRQFLNQKG